MSQEPQTSARELVTVPKYKCCTQCNEQKPLSHFLRRTGRRSGKTSRRGTCRDCRTLAGKNTSFLLPAEQETAKTGVHPAAMPAIQADSAIEFALPAVPIRRTKRPLPALPPKPGGLDASVLKPDRHGIIRMRGRTDKGRGWQQETDLETAVTLVREHAAIVVNNHTIRRLYSNKKFRRYILLRDQHTCHFCGEYGDTIDHLLPRAKGGHTTPVNCVCACNLCNQSKADRSVDEFLQGAEE